MNSRYFPVALVVVGALLLASGGWLWTDVRDCRETQSVMVSSEYTGPESDVVEFETLSDRERAVFLRAVDDSDSWVEADRDVSLPGAVEYRNATYSVATAHADDCGRPVGDLLVWGALLLGASGVVASGYLYRRE